MTCCTQGGHVANPTPRPALAVSENGWWLLARLAVHHHYNRSLARLKPEPLPGLGLTHADKLEIARLTLALAEVKNPYRLAGNEVVYMRRSRGAG